MMMVAILILIGSIITLTSANTVWKVEEIDNKTLYYEDVNDGEIVKEYDDKIITKDCMFETVSVPQYELKSYSLTCTAYSFEYNGIVATCWNEVTYENKSVHYTINFSQPYNTIDTKTNTIEWDEKVYVKDIEVQKCVEEIGLDIDGSKLDFKLCNMKCLQNDNLITCDSRRDGDGNGVLQSGESGFVINLDNNDWKIVNIKLDSKEYVKLKECVLQNV